MAIDISARMRLFSQDVPYRYVRPVTDKIIFLSCEGRITEEQYFKRMSEVFSSIKSKIIFVSVKEDVLSIPPKKRTKEQEIYLSKGKFWQLADKIAQFKQEKDAEYDFAKHPNDEFWIVADVDDCWNACYGNKWEQTIDICKSNGYRYAISNPFFELWLLLHHDDAIEADKKYAVTDEHPYEHTDHFRDRLRFLGVPMNDKAIRAEHYDMENVEKATKRARLLHKNLSFEMPKALTTTVFSLFDEIFSLSDEFGNVEENSV